VSQCTAEQYRKSSKSTSAIKVTIMDDIYCKRNQINNFLLSQTQRRRLVEAYEECIVQTAVSQKAPLKPRETAK